MSKNLQYYISNEIIIGMNFLLQSEIENKINSWH